MGLSSSGRDIFFAAAAQYTPDAPDALIRLYDARIGGGILLPQTAAPLPAGGLPGDAERGAGAKSPGNRHGIRSRQPTPAPNGRRTCPKGKRKVRRAGVVRCVKPKRHRNRRRANRERRAQR